MHRNSREYPFPLIRSDVGNQYQMSSKWLPVLTLEWKRECKRTKSSPWSLRLSNSSTIHARQEFSSTGRKVPTFFLRYTIPSGQEINLALVNIFGWNHTNATQENLHFTSSCHYPLSPSSIDESADSQWSVSSSSIRSAKRWKTHVMDLKPIVNYVEGTIKLKRRSCKDSVGRQMYLGGKTRKVR